MRDFVLAYDRCGSNASVELSWHVGFAPDFGRMVASHRTGASGHLAAVSNRSKAAALLDYFVGERQQIWRDSQAKCFRGFEVDDQFELGQLHDR